MSENLSSQDRIQLYLLKDFKRFQRLQQVIQLYKEPIPQSKWIDEKKYTMSQFSKSVIQNQGGLNIEKLVKERILCISESEVITEYKEMWVGQHRCIFTG